MRRLIKSLLSAPAAADDTDDADTDDKVADNAGNRVDAPPASFDDLLSRELVDPTVINLESDILPSAGGQGSDIVDSTTRENDRLRAEMLPGLYGAASELIPATPVEEPPSTVIDSGFAVPSPIFERPSELLPPTPGERYVPGFQQIDFWDRYDEATAAANLFAVPPSAITVVIGPLQVAKGVAQRCRAGHWAVDCEVFVLTEQATIEDEPTWATLRRPSDVVAVLENGTSDFPLIVLDIQRELPAWVRPLVARLRDSGVGLIHYVLDDEPSDEDLATWHGELGRPSVLDLAAYVPPERVLELLDRGEPIASVAGLPITTDLLLALRLSAT